MSPCGEPDHHGGRHRDLVRHRQAAVHTRPGPPALRMPLFRARGLHGLMAAQKPGGLPLPAEEGFAEALREKTRTTPRCSDKDSPDRTPWASRATAASAASLRFASHPCSCVCLCLSVAPGPPLRDHSRGWTCRPVAAAPGRLSALNLNGSDKAQTAGHRGGLGLPRPRHRGSPCKSDPSAPGKTSPSMPAALLPRLRARCATPMCVP